MSFLHHGKKKPEHHRLSEADRRTVSHKAGFTPEEAQELHLAAELRKLTPAQFMRQAALLAASQALSKTGYTQEPDIRYSGGRTDEEE